MTLENTAPAARHLLVLGAGGHGRVVADAAQASGQWAVVAFLDDRFPNLTSAGPWPVLGSFANLANYGTEQWDVALGIGDNSGRAAHLERILADGYACPAVCHPAAVISAHAIIGPASVVFATAVVNYNAVVGRGCIVNSGAVIEHDCVLGDAAHVSPRAALAGGVTVGAASWIGIGASVVQGVRIGSGVRVGAGAAVLKDLPDGVTAVGVPARVVTKP
jgi:sugar O-acyltransferase (sialic acid O-acetyltransferase NeuD family)